MVVLQKVSAPNAWVPLLLCPKLQCPYGFAPNAVPLVPAALFDRLELFPLNKKYITEIQTFVKISKLHGMYDNLR